MPTPDATQHLPGGRGTIRPAAVAGMFYPADPARLRRLLEDLDSQHRPAQTNGAPLAIIAPHAGFVYSGPIAASAYACLPKQHRYQRVGLIGPAHRSAFGGLAASSAASFATPLGPVALDHPMIARLCELPFVRVLDAAHEQEHALEVQLPFLMRALDWEHKPLGIVPLVVGEATDGQVAEVIERLWADDSLVVVSSDLSHYCDYQTAQRMDAAASRAIERLAAEQLQPEQACGCVAVRGLLLAASARGLKARTVDLRNSGDTAGPRDRVVGYGAYVFTN